ncbi:MAG: penicillin-binding protein 2 [Deltaproteobacteria bacterium]|nr:penicillin-binding protein 2 [Deltaproteobacteria bacterium]MBW2258937.1 penicillin-binding protein 2 [Deltaproteobacteria bacterium]
MRVRASKKPNPLKWVRFRIIIVGTVLGVCFALIGARAFQLHVLDGKQLQSKAADQYTRAFDNKPKRGTIYDRNHAELALSVDVLSICAYPPKIESPKETARALARVLKVKQAPLRKRLASRKRFVWIKRHTVPAEVSAVKALEIEGVDFVTESRRYYPMKSLAAQVVGFCNIDGKGLEGLEFYYNAYLEGRKTSGTVLRDALGRSFTEEEPSSPGTPGYNLILNIDKNIQYIAEQALSEGVRASSAKAGTALVVVPRTGAVLAVAHVPQFNPNAFAQYERERWRNRAITDTFEPGSTFKILLAATALESGVCTPSSEFYCEEGAYRIGRKVVHDVHPHETLSLADILKYSSNIGAAKVGKEVGPAYFHHKLTEFGIGAKLGVDCPGEASGTLLPVRRWTEIDSAVICFGQGVSLSALQLAAAVSTIANGGLLMKPYLVQKITDVQGRTITSSQPTPICQVISPENARHITRMMVRTVEEGGTGIKAAVEGYKLAGKTGTAQKADHLVGGYAADKYIASFVGFAPAENPEITVLVMIDEPYKEHYGGVVAAPVFRRIVRETLRYLKVPPEPVPPVPTDHGQDSPKQEDDRGRGDPLRVSYEAPTMG